MSQKKSSKYLHYISSDTLVLAGCALISILLMFSTFSSSGGKLFIDSKLWSDFGAHIPLIRSFSHGQNIPPEYPTFPGEPIRYHYLFYLITGLIENIGLDISFSLNLLSSIGFAALIFMIYKIPKLIFNRSSAGILAIFLFLFNGSLSFIAFFSKHSLSSSTLTDIISSQQFASFGPWDGSVVSAFWNLNIYTNQRHLAMGFALSLIILWPILFSIFSKKNIHLINYLSGASAILLLPLLHQASFFMTISTLLLLFLLNLHLARKNIKYIAIICLLALPGIIYFLSRQSSLIEFNPGFLAVETTVRAIASYWWHNIGLYLILIPIIFILSSWRQKTLLLATFPLFIIANLFLLSPDMINNHKLINYFMIFVVMLTSGLFIKYWQKNNLYKPIIIVCIFLLTLSGILDIFPIINDHPISLDDISVNHTATWIHNNTPPNSVFLTTTYLYNPASLAGRKTYLDYGYFNWSMGYDDTLKKQTLPTLFSQSLPKNQLCQAFSDQSIDYAMISPGEGEIPDIDPHQSNLKMDFDPEYISPDNTYIYNINNSCDSDL